MAPTLAMYSSELYNENNHLKPVFSNNKVSYKGKNVANNDDIETIKKKNEELEKELKESLRREQILKEELQKIWDRVRVAEDAEEILCSQLGELEVEAVEQAREYNARISALVNQLSQAHVLLRSNSVSPCS